MRDVYRIDAVQNYYYAVFALEPRVRLSQSLRENTLPWLPIHISCPSTLNTDSRATVKIFESGTVSERVINFTFSIYIAIDLLNRI